MSCETKLDESDSQCGGRDWGEVIAASLRITEPELEFDDDMRSADVLALSALMDNGFMERCDRRCGLAGATEMRTHYIALVKRDVGRELEDVVMRYGAPYLRPVRIAERVKDEGLADAACWSLKTLLLYANAGFVKTLYEQGMKSMLQGDFSSASVLLLDTITADPNFVDAYNALGRIFWEQGDVAKAIEMYERCVQLSPTATTPAHNRLLALNYVSEPIITTMDIFREHVVWGERFCKQISDLGTGFEDWLCPRSVHSPLRIAYISPDFCDHPTAFFARGLLEHHDPDSFEVFVYSNTVRNDDTTQALRSMVSEEHWREIQDQSAQDVAKQIHKDQITMLIDLAGHTGDNRLDVLTLKPAPLQFTYIGYPNTTGLGAVDFSITDSIIDPPCTQQRFVEELVHLPGCFLSYSPPSDIPDVVWSWAPDRCVTFGSISNLSKVSDQCFDLWSRVLQAVPGSRLLLKTHGLQSSEVRAKLVERFKAKGIAQDRLELCGAEPRFAALRQYNDIDIALDTFPYTGTTTTCEALLMGVPLITLQGQTRCSRVASSLLSVVGLSEYVATTSDEYVQKAVNLATDSAALTSLRLGLRTRFIESQLCNSARFVREDFEPMLRAKWQQFVNGKIPSRQTFASALT